jgi:hypothetical protein
MVLRCSENQWIHDNGEEKLIKLNKDEVRETELNIRIRQLFQKAQRCPMFNP